MLPLSRLFTGFVGAALLAGCATAPPPTYAVANSRIYPYAKEAVFERVLAVSSRNNLQVTATDKRAGVLSFERPIVAPTRSGAVYDWADCGLISLAERPISQLAELNMVVEPAGSGAKVTIGARYSEMRQDLSHNTHKVECTSTGALEQELLEAFAH